MQFPFVFHSILPRSWIVLQKKLTLNPFNICRENVSNLYFANNFILDRNIRNPRAIHIHFLCFFLLFFKYPEWRNIHKEKMFWRNYYLLFVIKNKQIKQQHDKKNHFISVQRMQTTQLNVFFLSIFAYWKCRVDVSGSIILLTNLLRLRKKWNFSVCSQSHVYVQLQKFFFSQVKYVN